MSLDGASAQEALSGLRSTWHAVRGHDPSFESVQALVLGWSEEALSAYHSIGCDDPLSGLATGSHLRSALAGLFREYTVGAEHPRDSHALVVVDVPSGADVRLGGNDEFGRALRLSRLGDAARTVFPGTEVIARLTPFRLAVLARRSRHLGTRVRLLRELLGGMEGGLAQPRVRVEGLPGTDPACGSLLDELARS